MPQFVNTLITNFSGGTSKDKRSGWVGSIKNGFTTNKFSLTSHFDAFTNPKKLVPYYKTEADETKSFNIVKFLYAPATSLGAGEYRLWGFGGGAGDIGTVYYHAEDLTATGWTALTGSGTGRNEDVFFHYKDYLYWWDAGTKLKRYYTVDEAAGDYKSITYTDVAQPVHHPADDIAYFFHDNKVSSLNDTTWNAGNPVLTLPANFKIVAGAAYGNYLAIACVDLQAYDKRSVVYLWDRDSSLATLTERIDFGEGEIRHLANLNNKLIAIMSHYIDTEIALRKSRVLIKQASGNFAVPLNEIVIDNIIAVAQALPKTRFITDNKIYFPMKADLNSDTRLGIWVVDEYGRATIDTIEEEATSYEGIYRTANMWWIAHSDDGSVNRTDDGRAYSTTLASTYESLIFNAGDSSLSKKLVRAGVMFEKLPAAGQVVLKYRIDGATSWTTLFTHKESTGSISYESINNAAGANLPEYQEIEFQVLSTGGAVITGLKFESEILDRQKKLI